jgi:hypothetical protein
MTGTWKDAGKGGAGEEPIPKVVVTIEIFDWAPGQSRLMWKADPATQATADYSAKKVMETVIREAGRAL